MMRVLVSTILIATGQLAMADCRDEWICVDAINQGGNVELRARNLRDFPITYTLRIRTRDLVVEGPETVTRTPERVAGRRGAAREPHAGP